MNINERLLEQLRQCRRDHESANGRAASAGHHYIERRLAQLDVQFPRHGFGWRMPTIWQKGLLIVPAIQGWHETERALAVLRTRCRSLRLHKLGTIASDLDHWAARIKDEFGKPIPQALSPRLKAWGVILDVLPAQPPPPVSPWALHDRALIEQDDDVGYR